MNNKKRNKDKGIVAFNSIYLIGIIFAIGKLIDYLQWTFQLIKKWNLPDEPFFSKVQLTNSNVEISLTSYLIFALAYIFVFGFIIYGLYLLNESTKLLTAKNIFQEKVGSAFRKAGKSFLAFAFGTLIIDIAFLAWANTSNRFIDLLSTELLVFFILGYFMFFLSDVFKKGIAIKKENELTI